MYMFCKIGAKKDLCLFSGGGLYIIGKEWGNCMHSRVKNCVFWEMNMLLQQVAKNIFDRVLFMF